MQIRDEVLRKPAATATELAALRKAVQDAAAARALAAAEVQANIKARVEAEAAAKAALDAQKAAYAKQQDAADAERIAARNLTAAENPVYRVDIVDSNTDTPSGESAKGLSREAAADYVESLRRRYILRQGSNRDIRVKLDV